MAYVYRHIRLDKNEPFYIGIGSDKTYKRANARYKGDRNEIWYKIVAKTKFEVEIIFDNVDWGFACEKEKEFIALYGKKCNGTGILANLTDGGEGVVGVKMIRSLESIEKQRNTLKERYNNDPSFKQMHIKHLREGVKKRKYSPESDQTRKKKSESHLLRYKNGAIPYGLGKKGGLSNRSIKVYCTLTNKIWDSIKECAEDINIRSGYLTRMLNGDRKNKTTIKYYGNK
jgi:hypothetical protein